MHYFIEIIAIIFSFFFFLCYLFRNKIRIGSNWPLVGMLPGLLANVGNIHEYIATSIEKTKSTNFLFIGPWFCNMRLLHTVDVVNVQHVMCKKFDNYAKGSKLREIFDVFGDSILNSDGDLWRYHRKLGTKFLCQPKLQKLMVNKLFEKVGNGVIPILDYVSKKELEIDLQDLFERIMYDITSTLVVGYDPGSLSLDFPSVPFAKALDEVGEVIMYRHVVPTYIWKLQRWIGVGQEKKYKKAWKIIDNHMFEYINSIKSSKENKDDKEERVDLLTSYMEGSESPELGTKWNDKFLRDISANVSVWFLAGRDTASTALSWFFYLLTKNPHVISKIKEEIASLTMHVDEKERYSYISQNFEEYNDRLIYLHGALCETLRLYPPVPFEAKSPIESDILPSGHKVDSNTQIIFNLFTMGRMKSIWGEDCKEFKPERWILDNGKIKHEPSYKFFSFSAGPRVCLGKTMAFFQMKLIAIAIILNYHIQPVDQHQVIPTFSLILRMKHGFKVKVHTV